VEQREIELLWWTFEIVAALAVVLAISVWMIVRIRARYRGLEDPTAAESQMLLHLSELRREGQLTEEEYRSIKGRLVARIGESLRGQEVDDSAGISVSETPSDHNARKQFGN
jgi:hypothetical protein